MRSMGRGTSGAGGGVTLRLVRDRSPLHRLRRSPSPSCGWGGRSSSLQLDVPVEIVPPALVEVAGREGAAMLLELPAGRPVGAPVEVHVRLGGRATALPQIARGAGGGDILPGGAAALGAGNDMVEGQLARALAILTDEPVAQEQVEAGKGGVLGRLHILAQRNHRRELDGPG